MQNKKFKKKIMGINKILRCYDSNAETLEDEVRMQFAAKHELEKNQQSQSKVLVIVKD